MARLPLRGPRPVDSRGRLTLPKEALEALGIGRGGFVEVEPRNGEVVIRSVAWRPHKRER